MIKIENLHCSDQTAAAKVYKDTLKSFSYLNWLVDKPLFTYQKTGNMKENASNFFFKIPF